MKHFVPGEMNMGQTMIFQRPENYTFKGWKELIQKQIEAFSKGHKDRRFKLKPNPPDYIAISCVAANIHHRLYKVVYTLGKQPEQVLDTQLVYPEAIKRVKFHNNNPNFKLGTITIKPC